MTDLFSKPLAEGDYVVFSTKSLSITVGVIIKINPKTIKVIDIKSKSEYLLKSIDVLKIDGPDLTLYLMRN